MTITADGFALRMPGIPDPAPENPFQHDRFQRESLAKSLTTLIEAIEHPLVLAVNGPWGSGKSTFLSMWRRMLAKNGTVCVGVDAWKYDYVDDPLTVLLGELDLALSGAKLAEGDPAFAMARTALTAKGNRLLAHLQPIIGTLGKAGAMSLGADPEVGEVAAGSLAAVPKVFEGAVAALNPVENRVQSYRQGKADASEFAQGLENLVGLARKHATSRPALVFFIDELDRCRPTFAVEMLERLKHFFSVEGVTFVLGVDREQLIHTVRSYYGSDYDAREYLRRFIDLSFDLPAPSLEEHCELILGRLGLRSALRDKERVVNGDYSTILSTARTCATLMNFPLRKLEQCLAEVVAVCAMTPTSMQIIWPELTTFLIFLRALDPGLYRGYVTGTSDASSVLSRVRGLPQGARILAEDLRNAHAWIIAFSGVSGEAQKLLKLEQEKEAEQDSAARGYPGSFAQYLGRVLDTSSAQSLKSLLGRVRKRGRVSVVFCEPERLTPDELVARDRGAPAPLDVGHDLLGAPAEAVWVPVKRVGEIAAEHRALAPVHELPDAVRPAEHADVQVHSHQEHVCDPALLEHVVELLPVVGHHVFSRDVDQGRLPRPVERRVIAGLG